MNEKSIGSREIEFRAWDSDQKIMIERETIRSNMGWYIDDEAISLVQYTGLKDKNGVKIFEGDIIQTFSCCCGKRNCEISHDKSLVKWVNSGFYPFNALGESENFTSSHNKKIIGNIFENPELL